MPWGCAFVRQRAPHRTWNERWHRRHIPIVLRAGMPNGTMSRFFPHAYNTYYAKSWTLYPLDYFRRQPLHLRLLPLSFLHLSSLAVPPQKQKEEGPPPPQPGTPRASVPPGHARALSGPPCVRSCEIMRPIAHRRRRIPATDGASTTRVVVRWHRRRHWRRHDPWPPRVLQQSSMSDRRRRSRQSRGMSYCRCSCGPTPCIYVVCWRRGCFLILAG